MKQNNLRFILSWNDESNDDDVYNLSFCTITRYKVWWLLLNCRVYIRREWNEKAITQVKWITLACLLFPKRWLFKILLYKHTSDQQLEQVSPSFDNS